MKVKRLGIIGCGFMGSLHGRVFNTLAGSQVVAVADRDPARAEALAGELGARAYGDYNAMLEREQLDAVVVATPDGAHREPVLAAAARGCGILVEKPLATTLEDADAMIEGCREAKVCLMVGHILRFEPAYAQLKAAVDEGMVGPLVSAFARRHAVRQEAERLAQVTDVVQYLAIHDFDQLNWIHPVPVKRVAARAARGPVHEKFGTPDVVYTTLEYEDGSLAVVESGWSITPGWAGWDTPRSWGPFGDVRLDVSGRDGFLSIDLRFMNLLGVDGKGGWRFAETRHWPQVHGQVGGALRAEAEHFLHCLATGRTPVSDGPSARKAVALVLAARESLAHGRPVEL